MLRNALGAALCLLAAACTAMIEDPAAQPAAGDDGSGSLGPQATKPSGVPCEIADLVTQSCVGCHGNPPAPGVPMGLTSLADFTAPAKSDPSQTVGQLSVARMKNVAQPMPPTGVLAAALVNAFEGWVQAGMPSGSCGSDPNTVPPAQLICSSNSFWDPIAEESELMNPGKACIACHAADDEGPIFQVAGTVFPSVREPDDCRGHEGAIVQISDAAGHTLNLPTNSSGNFFYEALPGSVVFPISAKVLANGKVRSMQAPVQSGDCNGCHTQDGANGAPGRIFLP